MKLPFLFKATEITITTTTTSSSAAPSWPWQSCATNPKTHSFRANTNDNIYKTMNSAYLDDENTDPDSFLSICNSFGHHHEEISPFESESTSNLGQPSNDESAVISGLMSDRIFFEPGKTSSILGEAKGHDFSPYDAGVPIVEMDSSDPFLDFRVSMEEMVEARGLKDWKYLEELLECYLRYNDISNHGYILAAFMDLLINHLALISASSNDEKYSSSSTTIQQYSFTSPPSFSSSTYSSAASPCLSSPENEGEIAVEKNRACSSSSLLYDASSSCV